MDINGLQILVGYFCTSVFMLSRVPMLGKAIRTRDLQSYSLAHLAMSACANLLFWIYVVGLPIGPVWILQIFFTVTDVTMLTLFVSQKRQLSIGPGNRSKTSSTQGIGQALSINKYKVSQIAAMK